MLYIVVDCINVLRLHWSIYVPVSNLVLIPPGAHLLCCFELRSLSFPRKIQCLPSRSIRGITYLLLGVRPITAEIHIRQLKLLCSIIRNENVTDFWEQSEISFWFQSLSTASLTSLFHVILHGTICNNVFMVGRS
jgi:hypothetical protein